MKRFLLSMALLLAFCVPWTHATEPVTMTTIVADGTFGISDNYYVPVYAYYCDAANVAQVIYPASYLTDLTAGDEITKLKFFVANEDNTGKWDNSTFNVKVANTTQANLSSAFDQTPTTTVYTGTLSATTANGMTVTFSNPFVYTGGNLLVQFEQPSSSNFSVTKFPGVSLTGAGRYKSGGTDISSGGYSTSTLPKCEITFTTIPPACMALQSLTATATRTSVTATWAKKAAMTNCAGYKVKLSSSSNPEDEAIVTQTISDPATLTYTFEHLDRETQYYVHARCNCGNDDGESEWTTTTVTTGGLVGCDPVTVADGTSTNSNIPVYGGYCDAAQTCQSIYPASMLTGLVGKTISKLKYYVSSGGSSGSSGSWENGVFTIKVMTTTATTLSSIASTTDATTVYTGTLSATTAGGMEINLTTPFTYTGGNLLIEFNLPTAVGYNSCTFYGTSASSASYYQYMGSYGLTGYSRDFLPKVDFTYCYTVDACPAVDTVIISDSTQTTANVSWTAATGDYANTYDLLVSTTPVTDFSSVTPRHTGLTGTTDTLQGLSPYTDYYVYVRVNCDGYGHEDGAAWSEAAYFKTLSNCITPSNLAMELRGKTTGMVTWTGTTQDNNYRYILSDEEVADPDAATPTATGIAADSVLLTGLTPGTHYYFYLSNACGGSDGTSPYMLLEFTTPDACIAPEDINITDIQKYQMTLNWTANPLADPTDAFDIYVSTEQVTEFEGLVPTYTGVTGNSKVLDTLQRNTLYYVYLRANCGAGTTTWEEVTATTDSLAPNCNNKVVCDGGGQTYNVGTKYNDKYGYGQTLYLASEIGDAGTITSMSIKVATTSSYTPNWKIYLGHTNKTTMSGGWVAYSDLTQVATLTTNYTTTGWHEIVFDTPFEYNGEDNLVVAIANQTGNYNGGSNFYLYYDYVSDMAYQRGSDYTSSYGDPSNTTSGTTSSYKMSMKFNVCGENSPCPALKYGPVIMNVTNNDADFIWRAGTGDFASSYDILLSDTLVTDFEGITPTVSNIPDTFYTFTDVLTPNTHYYSYIRVNCVNEKYDDGSSNWTSPAAEFITELPCLKPTNFVAGDYTSNSVNLSWVEKNQATEWNIIKNTNGDYDTIAVNVSQCTTSGDTIYYTYTGLQAATAYTFLLQANCQEDSLSKMATGAPYIYTLSNATDIDTIKVTSTEVMSYVKDDVAKTINITLRKGSDRANVAYEIDYSQYAYGMQGDSVELISPCDFTNPVTVKVYAQDTLVSTLWTITMVEEDCATPYNFTVTDIERRSAVLNWNVGDASTSFDLVVSDIPIDYPESGTIENITVTNVDGACTYTLAPLDRENTYYVYLRTNCGTTYGQWRGGNFTTPGLSVCGNEVVNNGTMSYTCVPFDGYNMDYSGDFRKSQFIYTDEMMKPLRGKTLNSMEFTITNISYKDYGNARVTIKMGITTATSLSSDYQPTPADLVYSGAVIISDYKWTVEFDNDFTYPEEGGNLLIQLDRTAAGGYQTVNFKGNNNLTAGISRYTTSSSTQPLDFLPMATFGYCQTNDACPAVDTVRVDEPGVTETTIHWAPSTGDYANRYQIIRSDSVVTDFTAWIPTYDNIYNTIYTLTGLTGYHTYYVYVRAVCDGEGHDDGISGWKGTTFLTESACPYPRNVAAVMTGKNTARLSWTNEMGAVYDDENFEYAYSTTEAEPASGTISTTGYGDLTGLANSTTYYCYVRKVCGEPDGNSPWIKTTLTTVPAMPAVINLKASNISYNAFTATWESDTVLFANETQWEVCVVTTGETPTIWETVNSREHFALGLISETSYDIYVRAKSGLEYSEVEYITVTTAAEPAGCMIVGTGTDGSNCPVSNYDYCYAQLIYPASEVGRAGEIEKILLQRSTYSNVMNNMKVYIGTTSKSSFSSSSDWIPAADLTEVYSGSFATGTEWLELSFNAPYEYDGTSNIVIAISNGHGTWNSIQTFKYTSVSNSLLYRREDGDTMYKYHPGTAGGETPTYYRTNIEFCFVQSACPKPNHIVVDQIATTTARAHWYPGSTDIAWEYYVSTEELTDAQLTDLMDNGQTENVMETVVDLEYLTKDMDYYFYLGIECDVPGERTDTLWTRTTFTTLPTCSAPITAQADNTGDNEITFDATFGQYGTVGTYDFWYWKVGTTDTTKVNGQVSQIVVNNVPGGDYDWQVRANCSGTEEGSSRWTAGNRVRVCGTYALPYTQGFEEMPTTYSEGMINTICWNDFNASSYYPNYYANTTYKTEGSKSLKLNSSSSTDLYLVMPEMMNAANLRMRFDYAVEDKTRSGDLFIGYMTDNADFSTFVKVDSIPSSSLSSTYTLYPHSSYLHNVPAGAHIAFCYTKKDQNYYGFLDNIVVDTIPLYNVAYTAAPATLGSLAMACAATDTAADGRFYENAKPVFTATPDTGMILTKWTNANSDSITNVNPWTLTVTADTSIIANFDTASYNLTVAVAPGYETFGTVEGSGTFKYMSENEFSATAIPHYHVVWNDGSYDAERTVIMPAKDTAFTATFAIDTFTVTTTQNVDSMGTITGAGNYTYGEIATITATPAAHHHFVEWSNGEITPQISVEVVKDSTLHATFRLDTVYVTALSNDDNLGQVSGYGYHGYNRPVTLIAHREPHYHVKNWSNGMTGDTIVIYPTGDTTVTCYFVVDTFTVSAVANPSAAGTFTGTGKHPWNDDVAVSATAAEHYHFVDWSDGSTDNPLEFLMPDSNVTLTANFALDQHTITVASDDINKGTVSGGGTADYGDTVRIIATAIEPYQFAYWDNGTQTFLTDTLDVEVLEDQTYTAYFTFNQYVVSVNSNDVTMGTVTGSGSYTWNDIDTITATPATNHHFIRWSNGSTDNPLYLTVTKKTSLIGYFGIDTFNINAVSNNIALGTVTGAGLYPYNEQVTLVATPATGCHFVSWSNGQTNDTLRLHATADVTLVATFAKDLHTVSAVANDATRGTVTGSGSYEYGEMVTIQATPSSAHFGFAMWSDGITVNPRSFTIDRDTVFTAVFAGDFHSVTANVNDPAMGTTTGGGNTIVHGTAVTLTATANDHYHFVNWSNGATTPSITVNADSNITVTATFAPDVYKVTLLRNNVAGGTVTGANYYLYGNPVNIVAAPNPLFAFAGWSDGDTARNRNINLISDTILTANFALIEHTVALDVNDAAMGSVAGMGTYTHGTQAVISATANAHYHFTNWSNGLITNPANIFVVKDTAITANFAIDTHTLTLNVNDMAKGEVTGAGTYAYNTPVQIVATPAAHCVFLQWSNGETNDTLTFNLAGDTTITAMFGLDGHTVTLNVNDPAMGSVAGADTYEHGTQVAISATANAHYHFVNWSNGLTANPVNIVVDDDTTITANFAVDMHNVVVTVDNNAAGTVTGTGSYEWNSQQQITANSNAHYVFAGWSDGDMNNPRTITVTQDSMFTATFTRDTHTITANAGVGGTVTGGQEYQHGAMATLVATANDHYHFVNWSNGVTTATFSFIVTEDSTVTANFAVDMHNVTAMPNDASKGSVTGGGSYEWNTEATLTAVATAPYHFVSWSNGETTETINVTVTSDTTLVATFSIDNFYVATAVNDPTMGYTTGDGRFEAGEVATLTAVANEHYHLVNWSNGDSTETINVNVTGDTVLTANFAIDKHNLTVEANDPDFGTTTGTGVYNYGDTVTLTATANEFYHFEGWSNGETDSVITIVVTGDMTVTAEFARDMFNVYANIEGIGTVTGLGQYEHGATVELTAIASQGYVFAGWSTGETDATLTFTMETHDTTVTATFVPATSVEQTEAENYVAYVEFYDIVVSGVADHTVAIYDMNGRLVSKVENAADVERFTVNTAGVYVIRVNNMATTRVVVK